MNQETSQREVVIEVRDLVKKFGDRTVLTLRHFSELSYAEIADVLQVDEKTVKSRLFEARQRLRAMLPEMQP